MRTPLAALLLLAASLAPVHASSHVASDETVVIFPTLAARDGDTWVVPVRIWVGELEPDSTWRRIALRGIRKILRPRTALEQQTLDERARWLLADDERGKRVVVRAGAVEVTLPETDRAGHARGFIRVPATANTERVLLESVAPDGRRFTAQAELAPPAGVLVISDVDDTLRVSEVRDLPRLLRRTMLEPFEPVPGMAALLGAYAARGARIAYVSAMPTQLSSVLAGFLVAGRFPAGELALRELPDGVRRSLQFAAPPAAHKGPVFADLLARFPTRSLVLIGDSGEADPELYGALARAHPGRVASIIIRIAPNAPMSEARRKAAFAGVTALVHVFTDVSTLPAGILAGGAVP